MSVELTLEQNNKIELLKKYIAEMGSVAVAFSAGVDSALLLKVAHDTLRDKAIAITAKLHSIPEKEIAESIEFCKNEGIKQIIVDIDELRIDGFRENPENRCYICKKALFTNMLETAKENGIENLIEGSNLDDTGDYRPGRIALNELNIKSPLKEAGLTKADIRAAANMYGLREWNKPSLACLSTRIPYGELITVEKLKMIEKGEEKLREMGFEQVRVRAHGNLARIETLPEDIIKAAEPVNSAAINEYFRSIGFTYVSLDLGGYKTGSMNREIKA
ncbi:MAG: ATP-dependent sacrificial sulfur transferase LarE [Lachnospiraceae bacterium]|nr:ATP-dependent sacrificial sulfur transferase LarE [Lachnospiraceae bacterium]